MIHRTSPSVLLYFLGIILLASCHQKLAPTAAKPTAQQITTLNSKEAQEKPYLILISLDGFRWDYVEKYDPPNLSAFIDGGVKAKSLIPSYPSKTFPNHYTIATGLYPDHHGILGNVFYSYKHQKEYNIRDRATAEDGSFYGGSPIWLEANKANMVTASYFFAGTEANIQGITPTYYYKYDGKVKNETRVAQAIAWLQLPAEKRPHLITMYFSDTDDVGHKYGPSNEAQIKKGLFELDKSLGKLFQEVAATGLPVNIIVVSDHGMADQPTTTLIPMDDIENDSLFTYVNQGSLVNIHPKGQVDIDQLLTYLSTKENHFKVYRTADTPGFEKTPTRQDWGVLQLVPDKGYYFAPKKAIATRMEKNINTTGVHGFDTNLIDMHGIFYAKGPAFKSDMEVPSVKNIHIYPLMCKVLELEIPAGIDGNINALKSVLRSN
ncbi:ectonucleotide pyrophosphatase/phosphodiesterase [Maribacter sp. X9]|uniref:alkaline phosphatase family protein n=1 Tax=Maribacter sp. X9 TaxID=3402159 RepID=UPI003AF3DFDE